MRFSKKFGGFSKSFAVLEKNWGLSKNLGAGAREESQNPVVRTINFPGLGGVTAHPPTHPPARDSPANYLQVQKCLEDVKIGGETIFASKLVLTFSLV